MAIIIIPVCFIAIFINFGILLCPPAGKKDLLIYSVLAFSLLITIITETLSAFSLITFNCILATWSAVTVLNIIYLYTKSKEAVFFINDVKRSISIVYRGLSRYEKLLCCLVLILVILVFFQGIIYPPNNWDSMTYHMARIPHWISHRSVDPYPTQTIRQIYQPPFDAYATMLFDVLNRSDYFSNSVQLLFMLFSLVVVVSIVKNLGLKRHYQILAFVLGATIPEVVLQASSTQNDVIECFFVLTAYYLALKAIKQDSLKNYIFLGIAIGLCILTKGTAYIYLSPILLIFAVRLLTVLIRTKKYIYIWYAAIVIFITAGINAPQYYRNYKISGNILGADKIELNSYPNQQMSPVLFLSSLIKNAGLQMGTIGTPLVAEFANKVIYKLHAMAGIDINSPKNNFGLTDYSSPTGGANHEDSAPNLLHFLLIFISIILIGVHHFKKKKKTGTGLLLLTITLQVSLFCFYLKWQPWNTRLHIPFFMLSVPLICCAASISDVFRKAIYRIMLPVILLYALVLILHNSTRPYITINRTRPYLSMNMPIFYPRYENYFANKPELYQEYNAIVKNMQKMHYKNIGLLLGFNDYEYPLFTQCFSSQINPISINVHNYTNKAKGFPKNVDCIVSTLVNRPFIDYNGKRYYNQDSKNKHVYLYTISALSI